MTIDVRRGTRRFVTREPGRVTQHSFSFGPHYDPANVGFGPLTCHDDHELDPDGGFPDHRHSDLEIVTWVVSGALVHDSSSVLVPGQVAVQSAGSGVVHSEVAAERPTRFVQAWLRPDAPGGTPARQVADVVLEPGRLTPLVGPDAPLAVGVAGAALAGVRLEPGQALTVPAGALAHVYVVSGEVTWASGALHAGDALRLTDEPAPELVAAEAAEVLTWTFAER